MNRDDRFYNTGKKIWDKVFADRCGFDSLMDDIDIEREIFIQLGETFEAALNDVRVKNASLAKGFWLDYPFKYIADADLVCSLCEDISEAILKGE